jgi:hypothetical protein
LNETGTECQGEEKIGGKSQNPSPPDPSTVSQAQTQSNIDTATYNTALNRPDTYTPLGSSTWAVTGTDPISGAPIYANQVSLNPTMQATLSAQQGNQLGQAQMESGLLGNVNGALTNPLTSAGLPGISSRVSPTSMGDPAIQQAMQQSYGSQMALLQPQFNQQSTGLNDQLAAEGITQGSDNWNTAQQNLAREQGTTEAAASGQAVQQGIGLQNQMFGQDLSNAQFGNTANQQQLQQEMTLRDLPLNELSALQSGSQIQMPQFQGTPSVTAANTNTAGNVYSSYQGDLANASASNASSNAMLGTLGSLGSAALMYGALSNNGSSPSWLSSLFSST